MEFEEYVATRGRALERYAYVLSGDPHLAQDLTQTALVKAYRRWSWVARADQPDHYVRRIVTTSFIDWTRRPAAPNVRPRRCPKEPQATTLPPSRSSATSCGGGSPPLHSNGRCWCCGTTTAMTTRRSPRSWTARPRPSVAMPAAGCSGCVTSSPSTTETSHDRSGATARRRTGPDGDEAPADPDLLGTVQAKAGRRWPSPRVVLAAGAAAAVVVAAGVVAAIGATGDEVEPAAASYTCPTALTSRTLPDWARTGFRDPKPEATYVMGAKREILGVVFGNPLMFPPAHDHNNRCCGWPATTAGR